MEAQIRRKLAMAVRVRDFVLANPGKNAGYLSVSEQLTDLIGRAEGLSIKEQEGTREERGSVQYRKALRRRIHGELLLHIERVAERVVRTRPELTGKFRRKAPNSPLNTFITNARSLLAAAQAEKDVFAANGMSETVLDDLAQSIKEFDSATESSHASRRDHVGARGQLAEFASEAMMLVGVLDGIVRQEFRGNTEVLSAWESASTVVRIHHAAVAEEVTPEVPPVLGEQTPPPAGGEKAA